MRETLRMVASRQTHHTDGALFVGQLHQQVVRATQLVGPNELQVFPLGYTVAPVAADNSSLS